MAAADESNLRRQSQTEGMVFWLLSLLADFGSCAENKVNYDVVINGKYVPHDDVDSYAKEFIEVLVIPASPREKC